MMPTMDRPDLYPIVIFEDRYSGCYSGGKWLAVARGDQPGRNLLETDAYGGDGEAMEWGFEVPDWVGIGQTPEEAIAALEAKVEVPDRVVKMRGAADAFTAALRQSSSTQSADPSLSEFEETPKDIHTDPEV
jgi:hypothetical protein